MINDKYWRQTKWWKEGLAKKGSELKITKNKRLMRFFQNKEGEGQMCRIYSSHPSRTLSIDFFVFFVAIMSMFRALESDTSSLH